MTALSLLCDIIAQGGKASVAFYKGNLALTGLAHHEFLKKSGVVKSVVCNECDNPHAAPIVYEALG